MQLKIKNIIRILEFLGDYYIMCMYFSVALPTMVISGNANWIKNSRFSGTLK